MRVNANFVSQGEAKLLIVYFPVALITFSAGAAFDSGIVWADPADHTKTFDVELRDYQTLILKGTGYSDYSVSMPAALGNVSGAGRTGVIEFVDPAGSVIGGADFGFSSIAASVQVPLIVSGGVGGSTISRPSGIRYTGEVSNFSGGGRVFVGSLTIDSPTYILLASGLETVVGEVV